MRKLSKKRKSYDKSIYYRWALNDAIRANDFELASAVWDVSPDELRIFSDFGLRYLTFLSRSQKLKQYQKVASEHIGEDVIPGVVPKQRYGEDNSLCWKITPINNHAAVASSGSDGDDSFIQVKFLGDENLNYQHVSCSIIVLPGRHYILKGAWRGEGITTLSGPFIDLHVPARGRVSERTDSKEGSWAWENFEIPFNSKLGEEILVVRIRRNKTDYLDSKISGLIQVKNLQLIDIGPLEGVELNVVDDLNVISGGLKASL